MAGNGIKLLERVGEGGMSTVWKAWDESRGCYVAVKVLAGEFAASGRDIASFREEERVMAWRRCVSRRCRWRARSVVRLGGVAGGSGPGEKGWVQRRYSLLRADS